MNSNKTVAVAMSGGVDSSVAAILLKNQGYKVIGITGIMQKNDNVSQKARAVCDSLDIEHHNIDMTAEFKKEVIEYFENSYAKGETPNPCVICNQKIKWGKLLDKAKELGADFYATGHYANIINESGCYKITRARDENKDQLYMLFELTQEQLGRTIFPIGNLPKTEVRKIAQEYNIPSQNSKESQDICFIEPPDSTKKYLLRTFKEQKGSFVEINTDKVLGKHKGFYQFTIGQRKGIGIAHPKPLYVIKIDASTNTVYVGEQENLLQNKIKIENINWQQEEFAQKEFEAMVKIRYNTTAKPAKIIPSKNTAEIIFKESLKSVTPGQAAVIYDIENTFLIGGGWIK